MVSTLTTYKQTHLVSSWASLTSLERERLLSDIQSIDFPRVFEKIIPKAITVSGVPGDSNPTGLPVDPAEYSPFPVDSLCRSPTQKQKSKFKGIAAEVLSSNKVACLLLAGGQGTRLGYDKCKGSYVLDDKRGWSLFDYIINRGKKQGCRSWWVMTSPMNHDEVSYMGGLPAR